MRKPYIVALGLLLGACSTQQEVSDDNTVLRDMDPTVSFLYYPGPGIDREVAAAGAEKLLELGIEALPTDDLTQAQVRLRFILCDSPVHEADPYLAVTYPCGDVEICSQYPQEPFTFAHEMGHALGMQHIAKVGIMFPRLNASQDFTENDWHEWNNRQHMGSIQDPACADHWKDPLRALTH